MTRFKSSVCICFVLNKTFGQLLGILRINFIINEKHIKWDIQLNVEIYLLTFKWLGTWGKGDSICPSSHPPPVVFPKVHLLERGWSALFFCEFWYYHKSHFSWKFHQNYSRRSENMKMFYFNINYFHKCFDFFDISLLQRN